MSYTLSHDAYTEIKTFYNELLFSPEQDGNCHYRKKCADGHDVGFTDLPEGDEDKLKEAVATVGPISIAIDASHQSFQLYRGGGCFNVFCVEKKNCSYCFFYRHFRYRGVVQGDLNCGVLYDCGQGLSKCQSSLSCTMKTM